MTLPVNITKDHNFDEWKSNHNQIIEYTNGAKIRTFTGELVFDYNVVYDDLHIPDNIVITRNQYNMIEGCKHYATLSFGNVSNVEWGSGFLNIPFLFNNTTYRFIFFNINKTILVYINGFDIGVPV